MVINEDWKVQGFLGLKGLGFQGSSLEFEIQGLAA